jgi:glycosyltransferase involved in cell wall biosynthesis
MKILIFTEAWDPQVNGVVRTLKMTTRELTRLGHEVKIVSPESFFNFPCPTYPEIRLSLVRRRTLRALIDDFKPDVLHIATEGPLGWVARCVALQRGWHFSTGYHSRFPEYLQMRTWLPVSISYAVLRRFHNAGSATLVPTPAMLRTLQGLGFTRAVHWGRGVNTEVFRVEGERLPRANHPIFLYVGRLAVEKSIEDFLELDLPGEKWVAGEGPSGADLRKRYPKARWFGLLSGEELAKLYRTADVMVFPSRTDTFGLVMIESMACGTPVAAYPVTGPIDVLEESQGGAMNADLKQACMDALAMDRASVAEYAKKFTWSVATEQFLTAVQPIAER